MKNVMEHRVLLTAFHLAHFPMTRSSTNNIPFNLDGFIVRSWSYDIPWRFMKLQTPPHARNKLYMWHTPLWAVVRMPTFIREVTLEGTQGRLILKRCRRQRHQRR